MAGGDEFLGLGGVAGVGAALMFMGAGTNVYDAFSAVMSSPWSTEKFTNDPEEEDMAREYVKHAMVISWIYAGGGAILAYQSGGTKMAIWPLVGAAIVTVYMYWLYNRALNRSPNGMQAGQATGGGTPWA
jgi:hypothetical protein